MAIVSQSVIEQYGYYSNGVYINLGSKNSNAVVISELVYAELIIKSSSQPDSTINLFSGETILYSMNIYNVGNKECFVNVGGFVNRISAEAQFLEIVMAPDEMQLTYYPENHWLYNMKSFTVPPTVIGQKEPSVMTVQFRVRLL